MDAELELYERQIEQQPVCVDPWFQETLSRFRAGEEFAARCISGSCLRIAYEIAVGLNDPSIGLNTIERIEEANAGLWSSLSSFTGTSADEFIEYARKIVFARLESWRGKAA